MICPECGTENSRWSLHCRQCEAALPGGRDPWLFLAAGALGVTAIFVLLLRMGVIELTPRKEMSRPSVESIAATSEPAGEPDPVYTAPEDLHFEFDLPNNKWRFEDPGEVGLPETGVSAVLAFSRSDGLAYGTVLAELEAISAQGLATLALERLRARSEGFHLLRQKELFMGGVPGEQAEFTLRSRGLDIHYLAAYIVYQGMGYQVLFWCLDRDFALYQEEFESALSSWRWKSPPATPLPEAKSP